MKRKLLNSFIKMSLLCGLQVFFKSLATNDDDDDNDNDDDGHDDYDDGI